MRFFSILLLLQLSACIDEPPVQNDPTDIDMAVDSQVTPSDSAISPPDRALSADAAPDLAPPDAILDATTPDIAVPDMAPQTDGSLCTQRCGPDQTLAAECVPGDPLCEEREVCDTTYGCLDAACADPQLGSCPDGTVPDAECSDQGPDCISVIQCGQAISCRFRNECPEYTSAIDQCIPGDPLCWVVENGQACQSDICPVDNICADAIPVAECPPGVECRLSVRCGQSQLCAPPQECDDCEPQCRRGTREVRECAANGRACERIAECCSELFCEVCDVNDPACNDDVESNCPAFTREVLIECPPGDPLCWTLPDGTRCLSDVCLGRPRARDCVLPDVMVPSCDGLERCQDVAFCGHFTACQTPAEEHACCDGDAVCKGNPVDACAPNGRRCSVLQACCNGRSYCEN